jgi:hypothetical protein
MLERVVLRYRSEHLSHETNPEHKEVSTIELYDIFSKCALISGGRSFILISNSSAPLEEASSLLVFGFSELVIALTTPISTRAIKEAGACGYIAKINNLACIRYFLTKVISPT